MTYVPPEDRPHLRPLPTGPSPMVGEYGAPAGAPPMPWGRWLLGLVGFPVRHPLAPKPPKRGRFSR
jgi:hypothetical protein